MSFDNSKPAIQFKNVSKLFYKQEQRTFKELLPALFTGKRTGEWFWALQDINLNIEKGETIGIIGKNGSGKSTLLKLIAGVSRPSKGNLQVNGKLAPLIELGAGFHPELTGRENVFLNGVILGLSRREIAERMDSIIAFSEIPDFIDQPIKHYSSGMYLRLAFAVAIHTQPDILLVDEILAVGDEAFQRKCLNQMRSFQDAGITIVVVSHNMQTIGSFCPRTILLSEGSILADGPSKEVIKKYSEVQINTSQTN